MFGKQRRETTKEQMRLVAHEPAVKSCVSFMAAAFSESTKKTDISIAVAERPRWSAMAANRIYIPRSVGVHAC